MDLSKTPLQNTYITNTDELMNDSFQKQTLSKSIDEQNENQNENAEQISNINGDSITPLISCPKTILCLKELATNETDNENMLKSSEAVEIPQKTEIGIEKFVGFQKEKPVVDEVETIEKIAEMIAISNKDTDSDNQKTKKSQQFLICKNHSLNICNSSDDNVARSSSVETNNISPYISANDLKQHKTKSIISEDYKKIKNTSDSKKICDGFGMNLTKTKHNEDIILEKSRFEEIEDKLEEMFAGIEDEQMMKTTTDEEKNVSFEQCPKVNKLDNPTNKELLTENCIKYNLEKSTKSSLLTKAAHRSENKKQLNLLLRDFKDPSIPKSLLYLKTMTPQRRLSIEINKEQIKLAVNKNDEINKNEAILGEKTPHIQDLTIPTEAKPVRKNIAKNERNKKNFCKYKKEINYHKTNIRSNKKVIRKYEPPNKAKLNRQKIKQNRIQYLLYSENDTEEKQLQTRDMEYKTRSPFILVKNNGNISVVNTVAPDDFNEKFTRSKKSNNYAHERKTVKGCYSSTLGNRYDADTTDSSWKCVFCKFGPHKKRLGDLFGPYLISSDCDEYRSTKDFLKHFQRIRRSDNHILNMNSSNTSQTFVNETPNSHMKNFADSDYKELIINYTTGMSQVCVDRYEIWVHEECAVWAPNLFVVGSRLVGLQEATWSSLQYNCVHCLKQGALLCCLQRGCKKTSHVPCAREFKWLLDESKFWVYCSKHALNTMLNKN